MSEASGSHATPVAPRDVGWQLACVLVYLALAIATGVFWEPSHDEGVAWRQAVGHLTLPPAERPAPIEELYATLGGSEVRSAQDVFDSLMIRGGLHPPAYYLMLHAWTGLVGTSRLALNMPAYLCGVLALFGIYRLTRRLVAAPTAPIWSMALLALSPWFIGFSNLAKPYAIVVCLALWSCNALLSVYEQPKRALPWRGVFVALSALGLYSVYHYAFVVAWLGLLSSILAWQQHDRWRQLAWTAAMGGAIAICFAPWVPRLLVHLDISAADQHYFSGSVPLPEWPGLALGMLRIFGLGEGLRAIGSDTLRVAWAALALASTPLAFYCFTPGSRAGQLQRSARWFWLSVLLLPLVTIVGDAWRHTHTLFISKLSFPLAPLSLILIVRAWHALPKAYAALGLSAWALLFAAASTANVYTRATSYTPFEVVAHALQEADSKEHLVVFSSRAQGYIIPFLLSARDMGVHQIRAGYAPAERLASLLRKAAGDPGIERVTLVDFAVTYRPQDIWRAETLYRLRNAAAQAGWRVAVLKPGASGAARDFPELQWMPDSTSNPGKLLVVSELANVKYYSMEVSGNPGAIRMRP